MNKRQLDECDTPTKQPKKGRVYSQWYRRAYTEEWPCIQPSMKGDCFALCTVCNRNMSVKAGGRDDCRKHVHTKQHVDLARDLASTPSVSSFVTTDKDSDVTTRAEMLFTHFLVEHNVPISVSDHARPLFKAIKWHQNMVADAPRRRPS